MLHRNIAFKIDIKWTIKILCYDTPKNYKLLAMRFRVATVSAATTSKDNVSISCL